MATESLLSLADLDKLLRLQGDPNAAVIEEARARVATVPAGSMLTADADEFRRQIASLLEDCPQPEATAQDLLQRLKAPATLLDAREGLHGATTLLRGGGGSVQSVNRRDTASRPSSVHLHRRDDWCRISGQDESKIIFCNIIPWAVTKAHPKALAFWGLTRLFVGEEGLKTLCDFLEAESMEEGRHSQTNLNGCRNLLGMTASVHAEFESFRFSLNV
ncbi:MAG: hypothetical protein M4579_006214 [Chaenotheca gracillima]|nr:MAG: hypothetical protein M4579_006214 [Chaenotheca gracillima]